MKSYKRQAGFTLVEIAIVLVIIGLLLGAILKGQELIENSRAKNAINEVSSIKAAHYSYMDRYKRLPGDDGNLPALQARGGNWASVTLQGNANGVIGPIANPFAATGEGIAYFQHLRAAGFITGDPAATGAAALPRNAFGGLTGIMNGLNPGYTQNTLQICQGNVPGKAASAIDSQGDDGRPNSGTVRATLGANNTAPGAAATAYDEGQAYTVCTAI
ncbi:MAG: type II secretion system protein [Pseudomonadota bacterium]